MRIVIAGGSGQVGHILARHFLGAGHTVSVLSRQAQTAPWQVIRWDGVTAGKWISELEHSDICINLAGRSVNCRYTSSNRKAIYDSRVQSTQLLNQVINGLSHPPRVWLNASTATIYRHSLDRAMDEASGELGGNEAGAPDTWNFSIDVAKGWENAFFSIQTPFTRKLALRSAITLSPDRGGVFDVLLGLVRHGLGGAQGSGTQYMSWVHEADFVRAVDFLINSEDMEGVVNIAAPNPVPNREFMQTLCRAWGTTVGLPAKAWMIELGAFFMKTESELVLKSRRVIPGLLQNKNFSFLFPKWDAAACDLVERWRENLAASKVLLEAQGFVA